MANHKKRKPSPRQIALSVLKAIYILIFVVSAIIVILYGLFHALIRPPKPVQPSPPTGVITQPTDTTQTTPDPQPQVTPLQRKEDFYTFLLLGTDDGNGNADTIMVASYDVKYNRISVLSVPRDTLVDVSRTVKKVNAAYGMGGVTQVLDELQPILGFRPDHYIKVDLRAFVKIVDLLGGVSFYVPEDMHHNDGAGFIIDLKQGTQWLTGEQAMQLVRYRGYANADLGRMQTQQKFLQQLTKQVLSWSTVPKINQLAEIFVQHLDTDLSASELAYFGTCALTLDFSGDVSFATLPGDSAVHYQGVSWYYELDPQACLDLFNDTVNPYTTDLTAEMVHIFQAP